MNARSIRGAMLQIWSYLLLSVSLLLLPTIAVQAATPMLSANGSTACLLRVDGSVSCWGFDYGGKVSPPPGPFDQISVGTWSACGLRPGGSVECWGQDAAEVTLPAGNYTQVDAGRGLACGVRDDQRIVCAASYFGGAYIPFPEETDRFVRVGTAWGNLCGIRTSGELACTGFGNGIDAPSGTFVDVVGDKTANFTWCAIRTSGEVVCWGNESYRRTESPPGSFVSVGIGSYHVCGLRSDQTIQCWGYYGNQDYRQYFPPAGQFISVGVDDVSNCALSVSGTVHCWGIDQAGEAPRLEIRPKVVLAAEAGVPYSAQLSVVDKGTIWTYAPYQPVEPLLLVTAGQLPQGITLGATGLLEGTTPAAGAWPLTVLAQDANGLEVERNMVFTAVEPGQDVTPPIVLAQVVGTNEWGDWYRSDVGIHWDITDPESGGLSSAGCEDIAINADTAITGVSYTCTARSTGGTISETVELRRDATPPNVTVTSVEPVEVGYYRVHFIASDMLSDIAYAECQIDGNGFSFCDNWSSDLVGPLDEGPHTFEVRAADNAGNFSTPVAQVLQPEPADTTAPIIVPNVTGSLGANGWYRSDVTLNWSVSDPESAITSQTGCEQVVVTADTVGDQFTCMATSEGGDSQQSVTIRRDTAAPDTLLTSTPDNPSSSASASFSFSGTDMPSGIQGFECSLDGAPYAACVSPRSYADLSSGNHAFAVRSVDAAGNIDPTPGGYAWLIQPPPDTTPPTVTANVSGSVGQGGWYVGPVQVTWTIADPESAIAATTGCGTTQLVADTTGMELTCSATSAGGTTSRSVTIQIDATAPDAQINLPPAPTILLRSTQVVQLIATDGGSGVASATCPPLQTASIGTRSLTCVARDVAGNARSVSASYRVVYQMSYTNILVGPSVINVAPSKQNTQFIWRLTDAAGQPVTDLANAVLREEAGGCGPIANPVLNPLTASTGAAVFRNLGNGNYSLSIKPHRSWRPSCRDQYIEVQDGLVRLFTITYPDGR